MKDETIAIHAGFKADSATKSVSVPIYQTVAYEFDSAQHGADLFNLEVEGNIYTRIMNPTTAVLEERGDGDSLIAHYRYGNGLLRFEAPGEEGEIRQVHGWGGGEFNTDDGSHFGIGGGYRGEYVEISGCHREAAPLRVVSLPQRLRCGRPDRQNPRLPARPTHTRHRAMRHVVS